MIKTLRSLAAAFLLLTSMTPPVIAGPYFPDEDVVGVWNMEVTINGVPICDCTIVMQIKKDLTVSATASLDTSVGQVGTWKQTDYRQIGFATAGSYLNPDLTPGGLRTFEGVMKLGSDPSQATGQGTVTQYPGRGSATFTFKGTKL